MASQEMSYAQWSMLPIADTMPAGDDARYEPEYLAVLEEIDKLSFSSEGGQISWLSVEKNARIILAEKSKDLPMTCYFAVALWHNRGLEGVLGGIQALTGFMDTFWENGWPVLARMRGRLNAISWWHERTKDFLQNLLREEGENACSLTVEEQETLINALEALDALIGQHMPDASPLRDIKSLLQKIPLIFPPVEEEPELPSVSDTFEKEEESEISEERVKSLPPEEGRKPFEPSVPSEPSQNIQESLVPSAATPPAPLATAQTVQENAPPPVPSATTDTASVKSVVHSAELISLRNQYTAAALAFATGLRREDVSNILVWQVSRSVLWGNIHQLPAFDATEQSNGLKITFIQSPDLDSLNRAQEVIAAKPREDVLLSMITMLEDLFLMAPLCLDIQKVLHMALQGLGAEFTGAATCVLEKSAAFFARLSGLEQYAFDTGRAFVSPSTLSWLQSAHGKAAPQIIPQAMPSVSLATDSAMQPLFDKVQERIEQKDFVTALQELQSAKSYSQSVNIRLLTHQLQIFCQMGEVNTAQTLAHVLLQHVATYNLESWDPDFALSVLRVIYLALAMQTFSEGTPEQQKQQKQIFEDVRGRIALLNPTALITL